MRHICWKEEYNLHSRRALIRVQIPIASLSMLTVIVLVKCSELEVWCWQRTFYILFKFCIILFVGLIGAAVHDRNWRIPCHWWWHQNPRTQQSFQLAPDYVGNPAPVVLGSFEGSVPKWRGCVGGVGGCLGEIRLKNPRDFIGKGSAISIADSVKSNTHTCVFFSFSIKL